MNRLPGASLGSLYGPLIWREWRHHPWRHAVVALAVALGVALAFSVHLINGSALAEFASAVRSTQGEPDLTLRGGRTGFDDALYDRIVQSPAVQLARPVLEVDTYAQDNDGKRVPLRVLGIDALTVLPLTPDLWPHPSGADTDPLSMLDPQHLFLNHAARQRLGVNDGDLLRLQVGARWQVWRVAGHIAAGGAPMAVTDLAGAQQHFDQVGRLHRIDVKLTAGARADQLSPLLPHGVRTVAPDDALQNVSQLSRAYRVNLTVLALVALFVGAFLVYSVLALSVAQRSASFALLGVLGMPAAERRTLVLLECGFTGAIGSLIGLALGAGLAATALRWLAGDLGGGFFPGITPALQFEPTAAVMFFALGVASALAGGWLPSRQAERLQPAMALKGLGDAPAAASSAPTALLLLATAIALAFVPPIAGLPLAAYLSVALLLLGGVALVPVAVGVGVGLKAWSRPRSALPLLALRRARFHRQTATAAVAGVVASLALSVALTVMVASFRDGVSHWLDRVLPADLYARSAISSAAAEQAWWPPSVLTEAAALPGVLRATASRSRALQLSPQMPPVVLMARTITDPAADLPLLDGTLAAPPGVVGVWVSEAMVSLHGAAPGRTFRLPIGDGGVEVQVLGVWRDYARQFGSLVMRDTDYRRLTGDQRLNDLALWLAPGADLQAVQQGLRGLFNDPSMIEFAASGDIRAMSLRIFDRSFAVTYYLQAVAILVGLVGVAASLSAQVLARRKEFGLLSHLGLTRAQIIGVVTAEAAAWLAAGTVIGLVLGAAVSAVLVYVVNPQSFHWTMDLVWPGSRLAALSAAVLLAGTVTAALSARHAASRAAVMAVKEDW